MADNDIEVELPKGYSKFRRYLMLLLVSCGGLLSTLASTIYFPSANHIIDELSTTSHYFDVSISAFMMCLGIFPLVWGGLADRFGRRWIFIVSLVIFIASNIGAALAGSIEMLIGMRIVQGIGSSAPLVVGVGVVSDIFPEKERGFSISVFFSGTLVGPIIGPIIGGFLDEAFGWRSTFWFMVIFTGVLELATLVFLSETLANRKPFPIQVSFKPLSIRRVGTFFNPFSALSLMKHPIVILGSLIPALTFATFFAIESFHSRAMEEHYKLNSSYVGLSFLVLGAGSLLGNFCGGKLSDVMNEREKKRSMPAPEARLHGLWACALFLVGGLLAYGWFIQCNFPMWAPILATFFIGFGYTSGSIGASAYLVDLAPDYASSITACATFVRMTLSTIATGFNTPIIEGLGYGYGITIHASLAFLVVLIILLLVYKGKSIRQRTGP